MISAKDNAESPLRVYGPGSNLADHSLLEVTAGGELIIAGGTGNGYRLAGLASASNPSGWAGVIKVKTPTGTTLGYILLYGSGTAAVSSAMMKAQTVRHVLDRAWRQRIIALRCIRLSGKFEDYWETRAWAA